jgi:hypothetical protein
LGKAFRLTKSETSVIEKVAAVPVFVAKPRAKFLTVQKLDEQLLFKLVRAMEMISLQTTEEFNRLTVARVRDAKIIFNFLFIKMYVLKL